MRCEQSRRLFDLYLDGELAGTLAAEFDAHRIHCSDCRRELALLEVSGHILHHDSPEIVVDANFTDRLLACMEGSDGLWMQRWRRRLFIAGPIAAAALIGLALIGVFDRRTQVAGERDVMSPTVVSVSDPATQENPGSHESSVNAPIKAPTEQALDLWIQRMRQSVEDKRRSGESIQDAFNLTILQLLDILQEAAAADALEDDIEKDVPADEAEESDDLDDIVDL